MCAPRRYDPIPQAYPAALLAEAVASRRGLDPSQSETVKARAALQKHIGKRILTPRLVMGQKRFEVSGAVPLTAPDKEVMPLVARDGIEL